MNERAYAYPYDFEYEDYEEGTEEFWIEGEVAEKLGFAIVAGMGAFLTMVCPPLGIFVIFLGVKAVW